jgi:hypothetical protein
MRKHSRLAAGPAIDSHGMRRTYARRATLDFPQIQRVQNLLTPQNKTPNA